MQGGELVIRLPGRSRPPPATGDTTTLRYKEVHHFFFLPFREQPIYSTRAHVFQIDPNTKKNWVPTSKHAVTVSYFYDSTRNVYRIISLDGTKVSGSRLCQCEALLTAGPWDCVYWMISADLVFGTVRQSSMPMVSNSGGPCVWSFLFRPLILIIY